jgi:hypothetical protein
MLIVKQLVGFTAKPTGKYLAKSLLGNPVERALQGPTKIALLTAVDVLLGARAEKYRSRVLDVMSMFLTDDVTVEPLDGCDTVTEAMQAIVARMIGRASDSVADLPDSELPTSSLAALSEEVGVNIDGDFVVATFIDAWLAAVKSAARSNKPELAPLADQLNHEHTQAIALGIEERVSARVVTAIQQWQSMRDDSGSVEKRRQWFNFQVEPINALMCEIYDDYVSGFRTAQKALLSGADLEKAIVELQDMQDRRRGRRTGAQIAARRLVKNSSAGPYGASVDAALASYVAAMGVCRARNGGEGNDSRLNELNSEPNPPGEGRALGPPTQRANSRSAADDLWSRSTVGSQIRTQRA